MSLHHLLKTLQAKSDSKKAKAYKKFFSQDYTDKKDRFLGVSLPDQRAIAKKYNEVPLSKIQKLLKSDIHEYRMMAGILMVNRFKKNEHARQDLFNLYLKNTKKFNNWDLVDATAPTIMGGFLLDKKKQRKILYDFAKSKNLWEKRMAVLATFEFIRHKQFGDTLKISEKLLKDKHDLVHKAIGWMLREIGKRDKEVLLDFLKTNYKKLPRTTLRYSIEKFPEEKRKEFLEGKFE